MTWPSSSCGSTRTSRSSWRAGSRSRTARRPPRRSTSNGFSRPSITPNGDLFIGRDATEDEARQVIRVYWASVSWVDWNVGRVLAELDTLGLRESTVVVFWGDHGYHLGEMGKWAKHGSLFEVGTRGPLIVSAPGMKANGRAVAAPVQSADIYPMLCGLCGLPVPKSLHGHSLKPLLADAGARWEHPALTVAGNAKNLGTAVRTAKYRYAEWDGGKNGAMLFDAAADPHELKNLIDDPKLADVRKQLAEAVRGCRSSGPGARPPDGAATDRAGAEPGARAATESIAWSFSEEECHDEASGRGAAGRHPG